VVSPAPQREEGDTTMANITRYNPLSEMVSLREAMDRLFEESVISPRFGSAPSARGVAANLYETAEGFVLQVPMPGVNSSDVEIKVQQEIVTLKWHTNVTAPEGATVHFSGLQSGEYQQSFTFPAPINADRAEASYQNGILSLTLPKAEHAKARTIQVNAQ
jgi:HSP20 family protein